MTSYVSFLKVAPGRSAPSLPLDHRPPPWVGGHQILQGAHLHGHGLGLSLKGPERKGQPWQKGKAGQILTEAMSLTLI